ncbi:Aliphatic sulfonates import ATP-binding protein SsuB [uncultured Clostridium sp.]|uniref:ATP-binding cassette domain-containing protein n=1 Tax=uncultured Clostridium sp. TaxID=59620 RepID=UPI0008209C04|nr:ATP-binding cassette domain-containing protein [uncultured Clostridium sp.]SCK04748.1 Aliphatic sulfonates import ATP-binding protein SsuB [uncultured Clostridium sp.]
MLIKDVNIKFDNKIIYDKFSIDFEDNRINCIVGASGCGKTTLLNYICDELLSKDIKISYVFQEDRLIPWKNVFDNLSIVIKNKYKKEIINNKIDDILNILDINEAKYLYPNELSGGMKQKVNIARALLYDFDILLLDEPFRSLDVKIKNVVINLIRTINYDKKSTIILVSHDKEEVRALADSIYLLSGSPISIVKKGDKAIIDSVFSSIIR